MRATQRRSGAADSEDGKCNAGCSADLCRSVQRVVAVVIAQRQQQQQQQRERCVCCVVGRDSAAALRRATVCCAAVVDMSLAFRAAAAGLASPLLSSPLALSCCCAIRTERRCRKAHCVSNSARCFRSRCCPPAPLRASLRLSSLVSIASAALFQLVPAPPSSLPCCHHSYAAMQSQAVTDRRPAESKPRSDAPCIARRLDRWQARRSQLTLVQPAG